MIGSDELTLAVEIPPAMTQQHRNRYAEAERLRKMRASDIVGALGVGDNPPRHRFDAEFERVVRGLDLLEFTKCA